MVFNQKEIEDKETTAPPYISYSTFTTLLDWLREMPVIPSQIDRSLWKHKFAGSTGTQLMTGLRFLRLLDDNKPQPRLDELAHADREGRNGLMRQVLRDAYGAELVDQLASKTPKMMDEGLRALGTTDATHRKAVSFFVNAARSNNVVVPPSIGRRARLRTGNQQNQKPGGKRNVGQPDGESGIGNQFALHPAVIALLRDLEGLASKWTEPERDRWLQTFQANLDYAYPPADEGEEAS